MNETARTSIYVACAIVSLIAANLVGPSVPKAPKEFDQNGTLFYPDFKDADAAKSLQVINYNSETAAVRVFGVEQGPDNVWRIPSRNSYPVDGKDRLAKSATSIIGIKRESLAGQRKSQHAEFGVLDPLSESVSDFKGVGNRLILKDGKQGKTLADLIVGKEIKGRSGYFYVRRPDEEQTYIAKISLDVSTKFADWIEPDLLKLDGGKLRTIVIDKHSIEFGPDGRGRMSPGKETNRLTRASSTDKWKLEDLDEANEEVNEDEVRKMVQALDDLKIVGVRPKNEALKKRLQDDEGLVIDERTLVEMQDKGYFFIPVQGRKGRTMISQEGDVIAITEQGVVYELHFGAVFTGSEEEVEAGFIKSSEEKKEDQKKDESKDSKKIKSRYLFAQASFDADALGPKPTAPEKPAPLAEEPKAEEPKTDPPADAATADDKAKKDEAKKAHDAAMAKFDADQKKYEADLKAYEDKVKTGEKLVKDLNRRFAEWYYVISGDSFDNLRQGRKTLIKAKATTEVKPGSEKPANEDPFKTTEPANPDPADPK